MVYVYIKSTFDCVDRRSLWRALRGKGVPDVVLKLLEDLCTHTGAKVHSGGKLSRRFHTSSGVRQGCILALALFCIAIDWILGHLVPQKTGITAGEHSFMDLTYADNDVILPNEGQAASTLAAFSKAAAPFSLKVFWAETKLQNLGYGPQSFDITITGSTVEGVEDFLYLGSKQTSDGRSLPDVLV